MTLDKWNDITIATVSYGCGISKTPLHHLHAMFTLINDGFHVPLTPQKNNWASGYILHTWINCDGFTTSDRWLVKQILHHLVFKGFTHVALEVPSPALDQNRLDNLKANCIGFTSFSKDHLSA